MPLTHLVYCLAANWLIVTAGCLASAPSLKVNVGSYRLDGAVTISGLSAAVIGCNFAPFSFLKVTYIDMYCLYSLHVTSYVLIQNGSTVTSTCGPSSGLRPASLAGLPSKNFPPGIGCISNETSVPGM